MVIFVLCEGKPIFVMLSKQDGPGSMTHARIMGSI